MLCKVKSKIWSTLIERGNREAKPSVPELTRSKAQKGIEYDYEVRGNDTEERAQKDSEEKVIDSLRDNGSHDGKSEQEPSMKEVSVVSLSEDHELLVVKGPSKALRVLGLHQTPDEDEEEDDNDNHHHRHHQPVIAYPSSAESDHSCSTGPQFHASLSFSSNWKMGNSRSMESFATSDVDDDDDGDDTDDLEDEGEEEELEDITFPVGDTGAGPLSSLPPNYWLRTWKRGSVVKADEQREARKNVHVSEPEEPGGLFTSVVGFNPIGVIDGENSGEFNSTNYQPSIAKRRGGDGGSSSDPCAGGRLSLNDDSFSHEDVGRNRDVTRDLGSAIQSERGSGRISAVSSPNADAQQDISLQLQQEEWVSRARAGRRRSLSTPTSASLDSFVNGYNLFPFGISSSSSMPVSPENGEPRALGSAIAISRARSNPGSPIFRDAIMGEHKSSMTRKEGASPEMSKCYRPQQLPPPPLYKEDGGTALSMSPIRRGGDNSAMSKQIRCRVPSSPPRPQVLLEPEHVLLGVDSPSSSSSFSSSSLTHPRPHR